MKSAIVGCAIVLSPVVAFAQVKLEVTPFFASYYATNYTMHRGADEHERQEAGPGVGLTVAYHFNRIVGVEGSATRVWSGVIPVQPAQSGVLNLLTPLPGAITFASARLTLQPRRSNYYLAIGPGIVTRSGEAWDNPAWTDLTNVAVIAGFGIRARITPEWQFNIGVDANFYRSDFDEEGGSGQYYQKRLQRDVMVTIGVPYPLLGR